MIYSILRAGSQPVSWIEQSSPGLPGQPVLNTGVLTSGVSSLSAAPVSHFPRPWHPRILKIMRGLYQTEP